MKMQFRLIIPMMAATMFAACSGASIYDDYGGQRQLTLHVNVVDSDGIAVPESKAHHEPVYYFVNGIYSKTLTKTADNNYRIVVEPGKQITLVAMASEDTTQYTLHTPTAGEDIGNLWMQMQTSTRATRATYIDHEPKPIYYGSWTGSAETVTNNSVVNIPVTNVLGKARVVVRGLRSAYGDGDYRVVIEGCRTGMSFDGSTTKGAFINYEMEGGFDGVSDNWVSSPVKALPTKGSTLHVKVYKQNGENIIDETTDYKGNALAVTSQQDNVFLITVGQNSEISIRVVSFEDLDNNVYF